jgi:hypothetical protein
MNAAWKAHYLGHGSVVWERPVHHGGFLRVELDRWQFVLDNGLVVVDERCSDWESGMAAADRLAGALTT